MVQLQFTTPTGAVQVSARAVVLALGGASWARLGSGRRLGALVGRARCGGGAAAPVQLRF